MATWTREQVLGVVRRSPELVAEHDRDGWLGLFVAGAVVEDPVGSRPVKKGAGVDAQGDDELGRFYDTFIAPNEIRFEIADDFVVGLDAARDARIHTRVPGGFEIVVPAYLLYQLVEHEGGLRVRRMAAHWNVRRLTRRALGSGWRGWPAMTRFGGRILGTQGWGGIGSYVRAFRKGVFGGGLRVLGRFAELYGAGDGAGLAALFVDDGPRLVLPDGAAAAPAAFCEAFGGGVFVVEAPVAAGFTASCRYALSGGTRAGRGIALFEFDAATRRLAGVRLFGETVGAAGP